MMFLALLFYIYCIIGALVVAICTAQEKWPKYMSNDSSAVDFGPTVIFFLLCGPVFWVGLTFFVIFRWVMSLVEEEE